MKIERSVFLGHTAYESLYRYGVAEACVHLDVEHAEINLLSTLEQVDTEVREARPDLIWGHMLFWAPHNSVGALDPRDILALCAAWKRDFGCRIVLHDGDPRLATRFPHDISSGVDLVLANHRLSRDEWRVPQLYWPFGCPTYKEMVEPCDEFRGNLVFTGTLRDDDDSGLYDARTACLRELQTRGVLRVLPEPGEPNTMPRSAEVAASASAIIGFGRPEIAGWIDTRVFQVAGAGGVLLHDDVGFDLFGRRTLVPWLEYIPTKRYDVDSILWALDHAHLRGPAIREHAFLAMQAQHTWTHRVIEVLTRLQEQA